MPKLDANKPSDVTWGKSTAEEAFANRARRWLKRSRRLVCLTNASIGVLIATLVQLSRDSNDRVVSSACPYDRDNRSFWCRDFHHGVLFHAENRNSVSQFPSGLWPRQCAGLRRVSIREPSETRGRLSRRAVFPQKFHSQIKRPPRKRPAQEVSLSPLSWKIQDSFWRNRGGGWMHADVFATSFLRAPIRHKCAGVLYGASISRLLVRVVLRWERPSCPRRNSDGQTDKGRRNPLEIITSHDSFYLPFSVFVFLPSCLVFLGTISRANYPVFISRSSLPGAPEERETMNAMAIVGFVKRACVCRAEARNCTIARRTYAIKVYTVVKQRVKRSIRPPLSL